MEAHKAICAAIDNFRETAVAVSRSIHARPEPKFQEHFAAEQLSKAATGLGLKVDTGIAGMETAFRASSGALTVPPSQSLRSTMHSPTVIRADTT